MGLLLLMFSTTFSLTIITESKMIARDLVLNDPACLKTEN